MDRDNGDTGIATANDPWGQITTIVAFYGGSMQTDFNAATEVAIFDYDSGSMTADQVRATVAQLRADAIASGRSIASTLDNITDDVLCPFTQGQCCTNAYAGELMTKCGLDNECNPATNFAFKPDNKNGLIREYCDNVFATDSPYYRVCPDCVTSVQEDDTQSIEYKAIASNDLGQNLDYIPINYELQYDSSFPLDENPDPWVTIEDLPDDFSGVEQSLNVLIDNWPGSPCDHAWLDVFPPNSDCTNFIDYALGSCIRRVYDRKFRIKGTTIGFGNLVAYSNEFQLYEWRNDGAVVIPPPSPPPEDFS
jgi:hypothetical protein